MVGAREPVVEWRSGTVPLVAVRVRSLPTRYCV